MNITQDIIDAEGTYSVQQDVSAKGLPEAIQRVAAAVLLFSALPLMGFIAVCLFLSGVRRIMYVSTRLGLGKERFQLLKFSSMVHWNTEELHDYLEKHPTQKEEWERIGKLSKDPRITRFGYLLRHSSLDELPQLWNVVKGEMALVGPRPIIGAEDRLYGRYSGLLHSVKPGITGLWQVSGRNLLTYDERIAINLYYVKNRSWKLDVWILYKTVGAVLSGRGAL